ncbi:MAG: succinylglutamate desuccinylase/aspartoacylase family protein [Oligoflexia bacterium]|nr:succinylglutamate desuccinylase/aspartoacylase family protein [Oligoflexia bacterium]
MILSEIKIGKSVEGKDIRALKTKEKSPKYLYLLAGVHGDEVEGVYVLQQIIDWIELLETLGIPLIIIPILNLDGYCAGTRVNAHGVDLNRNLPTSDWMAEFSEQQFHPGPKPLSEPENEALVKLFEQYPPKFMISFHSWRPLLNYNGECKDVADFISQFNKYPVADNIGYSTPGSLGKYLPEKHDVPVITFEFPKLKKNKSLKDIWDENKVGLLKLFTSEILLGKFNNPQS